MTVTLLEGAQNRLIIEHMWLVPPIAAEFRGKKGIPFEDLEAQGMVGLTEAARNYDPTEETKFSTFATFRVRGSIQDFIDQWQVFAPLPDDLSATEYEDRIHEWAIFGDLVKWEGWKELPATPEEILIIYEEMADKQEAVQAALISLSPRERRMVEAHFLRKPRLRLDQVARNEEISYYRTVELVYGAVKKMRSVVETYMRNKSGENRRGRRPSKPRGRTTRPPKLASFKRPKERPAS